MTRAGRKAWLITWEDFGCKHWGLNKPRVVAVLSSRFKPERVKRMLVAIWCAQADLTLSERMYFGLDQAQQKRMFMGKEHERFTFGLKPYLYARKVSHLRCKEHKGVHTLHWKEISIYKYDEETHEFKVIRPEFDDSFSQHEKEAIGKHQF
ncbi:MAG TPA: hypothetical protein VGM58_04050 [Verrucomicrobiae bacterium]|jgi:hypothetical protein